MARSWEFSPSNRCPKLIDYNAYLNIKIYYILDSYSLLGTFEILFFGSHGLEWNTDM